jgi:hypothetical protein
MLDASTVQKKSCRMGNVRVLAAMVHAVVNCTGPHAIPAFHWKILMLPLRSPVSIM